MIKENGSSITKRKIRSYKYIVILCAALAFIGDIIVLLALAVNGFDFINYLVPLIMACIDLLFIVAAFFSDFRFRYTQLEYLLYALCTLVGSFLCVYFNNGVSFSDGLSMTNIACIAWYALHALVCVAVIISSLYAVRFDKTKSFVLLILSLIFVIALAASSFIYINYVYNDGFFGQGTLSDSRTLVYEYDEDDDSYSVVDVINSDSNIIEISDEFNGKTVTSVNCKVFAAEGVTVVKLGGDVQLTNVIALEKASSELVIYADKEYADDFKQTLYSEAVSRSSDTVMQLANNLVPDGLSEDEIYISFTVSAETYEFLDGKIPEIWYGSKGTTFSFSEYSSKYSYFEHTDITSDSDLCWAYNSNGGYILTVSASDGTALVGAKINQSTYAEIDSTQVYRIYFGNDNDSKYTLSTSYTQTKVGSNTYNYRYTILNNADNLIKDISRSGFSLTWYYRVSNISSRKSFSSLAETLATYGDDLIIYPEWQLNSPEVTLIADNSSVVYGDSVLLTASASHEAQDILYLYEWTSSDGAVAESSNTYSLNTPTPSQSGTYKVTVTAYSDNTSLTSSASGQITITITKKQLAVIWTLPEDMVYSGTYKTVTCELQSDEFVNDDVVELSYYSTDILDAGTYNLSVSLDSASQENYSLTNYTKQCTIAPYSLNVSWVNTSFTYTSTSHVPSASATGVASDGEITIAVSGGQTNAGTYTATASTSNTNYTISNSTQSFTINKATVAVVWDDTTFMYNGSAQKPTATATGVGSDGALTIIVSGEQTNAGTYTATASASNTNYIISNSTQSFTINKAIIAVTWSNTSLTYNGYSQAPTATATGVGNDGTLSITVSDAQTNVGSNYTATASTSNTNYTISNSTQTFSISAYSLSVNWHDTALTYNGGTQKPTATATGVGSDGTLSITVSDAQTNVGTYIATASTSNINYTISNSTQTFSISAYSLTVTWSNTSSTYNGYSQAPTATATGVGNDGALTITVSGGQTNAGTYTATASASNTNYTISNSTQSFTINKATVAVTWSNTSLTYSGYSQAPTATATGVGNDGTLSITVSDAKTNAGTYTATASTSNTNYTISNSTQSFTINKATVAVTWSNTSLTYNGYSQAPTATATGVGGDGALDIIVDGTQTDVGDNYTATAIINNSNYIISNSTQTFSISAYSLTVTWSNTSLTYNGYSQAPTATATGVDSDGALDIIVDGAQTDVGDNYTATARIDNSNYTISNPEQTFKIVASQD